MQKRSLAAEPCPVARTLDVVGEWWTLLIVRDAFRGARRFEDFKTAGIADNVLAARLRKLVEGGVFERRPYQERPVRHEYVLTEKGEGLLVIVAALAHWGQHWTEGPDMTGLRHEVCGHSVSLLTYCDHCERTVGRSELRPPTMIRPLAPTGSL